MRASIFHPLWAKRGTVVVKLEFAPLVRVLSICPDARSVQSEKERFMLVPILSLAVAVPVVTQPPQISNQAQRLLASHNRERALAGVPPLRWNRNLEVSAAAHATFLAGIGRLQHSAKTNRPGQAENLWMGTRAAFAPEQMVANWAAEKRFFRPGVFPYVSSTGNWLDVSHYAQMIWRNTTYVGCAVRSNGRVEFLVCRYWPKGNRDGQRVP